MAEDPSWLTAAIGAAEAEDERDQWRHHSAVPEASVRAALPILRAGIEAEVRERLAAAAESTASQFAPDSPTRTAFQVAANAIRRDS